MKRLSFTAHLILFSFLTLVVGITWTLSTKPLPQNDIEPLADPISLRHLIAGTPLPTPIEESRAEFHGATMSVPPLASLRPIQQILGVDSSQKRIEVDLTNQRVYAYEGTQRIMEFVVSTGKWYPTPTGEFTIWTKVRSQKMSGGNPQLGTYYYLPGVPWVMFFSNNDIAKMRGFSLHGTYWHDNFGHPMSHGCINMRIEDAQKLYDWADPPVTDPKAWSTNAAAENPGTRVVIYGTTPKE